jgi:hypothetical protein
MYNTEKMPWIVETWDEQLAPNIEVEVRPTMNIKPLIGWTNLRDKPPIWQRQP